MRCGKYMDPTIIISKYKKQVEALKEVEGVNMSKKRVLLSFFFWKKIQKSKVMIKL